MAKRLVCFVLDTSASMNQVCSIEEGGMSYLDVAKAAVEHFVKLRGRDPNVLKMERFFLVCYEENFEVVSGWKENLVQLMEELKYLRAVDTDSNLKRSLQKAYEQLNQFRVKERIDNYGFGRRPWFLKNSIVILITDGVQDPLLDDSIFDNVKKKDLFLATSPFPPCLFFPLFHLFLIFRFAFEIKLLEEENMNELTKEVYRWDQRLFTLHLQIPSVQYREKGVGEGEKKRKKQLERVCEKTGGQLFTCTSLKCTLQMVEQIHSKFTREGVVVHFEALSPSPPTFTSPFSSSILLPPLSKNSVYWWPLPENFLLPAQHFLSSFPLDYNSSFNSNLNSSESLSSLDVKFRRLRELLVRRTANPKLFFSTSPLPSLKCNLLEGFPVDKYQVEASSPLSEALLKLPTATTWPVFQGGTLNHPPPPSSPSSPPQGRGEAIGFLRASKTKSVVHFYVLPYNFGVLFGLLEELLKSHGKGSVSLKPKWKSDFENNYLSSLPFYYLSPLRSALKQFTMRHSLSLLPLSLSLPDNLDSLFSHSISLFLNSLDSLPSSSLPTHSSLSSSSFRKRKRSTTSPNITTTNYNSFEFSHPTDISGGGVEGEKVVSGGREEGREEKERKEEKERREEKESKVEFGTDASEGFDNLLGGLSSTLGASEAHPLFSSFSKTKNNIFNVERKHLLQHIHLLSSSFLPFDGSFRRGEGKEEEEELKHNQSVAQMGNYHEFLFKQEKLRSLEQNSPLDKKQFFGNPFRSVEKVASRLKGKIALDETFEQQQQESPKTITSSSKTSFNKQTPIRQQQQQQQQLQQQQVFHLPSPELSPPSPSEFQQQHNLPITQSLQNSNQANEGIKMECLKLIRDARSNQDTQTLFSKLSLLTGNKTPIIKELLAHAQRFKKLNLVQQLTQLL